jgi:hypothetical protein
MNTRLTSLIMILGLALLISNVPSRAAARGFCYRDAQPQTVTLLSHITHNNYGKANFDSSLGLRGDSISPSARKFYDVRYGGMSYDGDNDWFDVPIAHGSRSKIRDMGILNWADVFDVPILYVNPEPYHGVRTDSFGNGKLISSLPEDTMVKVIVGHMYLVHTKNNARDLYVMFRVESLKAGDEVKMTWKVVTSPESN